MLLPELIEGNAGMAAPLPPLALVCLKASEPCTQAGEGERASPSTEKKGISRGQGGARKA